MGRDSRFRLAATCAVSVLVTSFAGFASEGDRPPAGLEGLRDLVQVHRDAGGAPHIFARNDHDAAFMLGYVQSRERFFEMDVLRRTFGGTLAELVGPDALAGDVQFRALRLRRVAEESYERLSDSSRAWLSAFSAGVNVHLDDDEARLSAEYEALELDRDAIPAWSPVDSLLILKGVVFTRTFDLSDLRNTAALLRFHEASFESGFDATALFFDEVYRGAPFDAVPIHAGFPDPGAAPDISSGLGTSRPDPPPAYLGAATLRLIADYEAALAAVPLLRQGLDRDASAPDHAGLAGGAVTGSGHAVVTQSSLLGSALPASFFEVSVHVRDHVRRGVEPLDVSGVALPGVPAIVEGCNPAMCWGASAGRLDATDVYQETLVLDPETGLPAETLFDGEREPLIRIAQRFRYNRVGDELVNNVGTAEIGELEGGLTLIVPRRNHGPMVSLDLTDSGRAVGLSLQSTAWSAGGDFEAFIVWARARDMEEFTGGLKRFGGESLIWSYADIDGHVALFSSGKVPLREDLQELGGADGGLPPFFVRDGTHVFRHEWVGYGELGALPWAEMPHLVDPSEGWLLSAGNDPVGATFDNDALDQERAGGGLYYLGRGFARGFRSGQLNRLFERATEARGELSLEDLREVEANHELPDASFFVPHLTAAWLRAGRDDAPEPLRELALDEGVSEAVGRLAAWDHTAPPGFAEGGDPAEAPRRPDRQTIEASVAATLYSVWRARLVGNVIDDTLSDLGLADVRPGGAQALTAIRHLLGGGPRAGSSGVDFFGFAGVDDLDDARAAVLLASLREALDLLAGDAFAEAFEHSVDQDDYRWGLLHRSGDAGSEGAPRAGGFGAVAGGAWEVRGERYEDFRAPRGPGRSFLARLAPSELEAWQVVSPGPSRSGEPKAWTGTDLYRPVRIEPADVIAGSVEIDSFLPKGSVEKLVIFASPSRLSPSGTSTIAIVARNAEGTPARPGGRIRLIADQGTIASEVFTDENGEATATFTAGPRPGTAVVTAIRGTGDTANVQLEIRERRPVLFVEATPSNLSVGESSTITVIVRDDDLSPLGAGRRVRLATSLGTVESEVLTDENGEATATFHAGDVPGNATVTALVGNSEPFTVRIDIEEADHSIFLHASPSIIPVTGISTLTIIARDRFGNPLGRGERIRLVTDLGTLERDVVFTNGRGEAETTFLAGSRPGNATITAFPEAGGPSSVDVTIRDAPAGIFLAANPVSVPQGVDSTIDLLAFVVNAQGVPVAGTIVVFETTLPGAVFEPGIVVTTNSQGQAAARLNVFADELPAGGVFTVGARVLGEAGEFGDTVAVSVR